MVADFEVKIERETERERGPKKKIRWPTLHGNEDRAA